MSASEPSGTLSVVIPTKGPDPSHLARTLDSIGEQDYPVEEVIIVDGTDGRLDVSSDDVSVRVVHRPDMPRGDARREGMRLANSKYVAHFDEDAVLMDEDYFSEAVRRLQQPDVSAVGGTVFPIRGNPDGQAVALLDRFNPTTLGSHNIVHERALCTEGECFFFGQGRGEDISIRRELSQHGKIERMERGSLKDLPTLRQEIVRDLVIGTFTGAIAGAASGWVRDKLEDAGRTIRTEAEEDLRA